MLITPLPEKCRPLLPRIRKALRAHKADRPGRWKPTSADNASLRARRSHGDRASYCCPLGFLEGAKTRTPIGPITAGLPAKFKDRVFAFITWFEVQTDTSVMLDAIMRRRRK